MLATLLHYSPLAGLAALWAANLLAPAEGWDRHPQLEIIAT